ncbi:unnamed protein product, partial [Pipistrellus nathusii]
MGGGSEARRATGQAEMRAQGESWGDEMADGNAEGKALSQRLRAVSTDPLAMTVMMSFALCL